MTNVIDSVRKVVGEFVKCNLPVVAILKGLNMNNRPVATGRKASTIAPNSKGVECLYKWSDLDIKPFQGLEKFSYRPVDCIYGYSNSTLSALLENALLFISYSLKSNRINSCSQIFSS